MNCNRLLNRHPVRSFAGFERVTGTTAPPSGWVLCKVMVKKEGAHPSGVMASLLAKPGGFSEGGQDESRP